jgi:xanthine dehydrogenase accessory factor
VIVTRGHKHDENCLRILLNTPARYIGMIGSAKRVITVFRRLLGEGFSMEVIQRVHAPIGLDIGARAPAEIAVSILAEIILTKHGGTGAPKRHEVKPAVHLKK